MEMCGNMILSNSSKKLPIQISHLDAKFSRVDHVVHKALVFLCVTIGTLSVSCRQTAATQYESDSLLNYGRTVECQKFNRAHSSVVSQRTE